MAVVIAPGDLNAEIRTLGRPRVFYAPVWSGATNLTLAHLADTEGDVNVAANDEFQYLTASEVSGPAKIEGYVQGSDPVVTLPLYLANPALRPVVTPTGVTGGAGYSTRRPLKLWTLVLFPEELFRDEATNDLKTLSFAKGPPGAWTLNGAALTPTQKRLLDMSVWIWAGHFVRAPIEFKHGDAGKLVTSVTFQAMMSKDRPEGQKLYTRGDPADVGINIHPAA